MNTIVNNIRQRLSLRKPLAEALDLVAQLTDKLTLKKIPLKGEEDSTEEDRLEYAAYLNEQLNLTQEICPFCQSFERDFPSFAFSIATGIGKTRLMGACIAYLYLKKGIRHFFILAPNLTLYEKLIKDFGDPSYEKYVFKGLSEFIHNQPVVINGDNYNSARGFFSEKEIQINVFNIAKFNTDSKDSKKGAPKMRRLSEYLGQSYFDYLAGLDDLVVLMDEAHRYHADASKKAINEMRPLLGLEMTATPTDEKGKSFKNIVYEYNLAQALEEGKYVKIPAVAKRRNYQRGNLSDLELDALKLEDAISIHEHTKLNLELYARNNQLPIVKPFILVVCKNIEHATEIFHLIEDDMFDGRYKGKVLQIDSSTKKNEEVDRLFVSLEQPDNEIEIVIHVNMLKEGWDVTNLYTIVPLRAADAPILIEQSIGRGLRLPYGGKRTGNKDADTLTVIAHDNFEAVIKKANDPSSVLSKFSYIELDEEALKPEPGKVVPVQTIIDFQEKKAMEEAKTEIAKQEAKVTADAKRAVWNVIPKLNTEVKSKEELSKPVAKDYIRRLAIKEIEESAKSVEPIFAQQIVAERIQELDNVIDVVVEDFINNIIEIPRMTIQKEVYQQEYKWFDLDTRMGFGLPVLKDEIIRVSIGAGEHTTEVIEAESGRKFEDPLEVIVNALIDYDDIDYDETSDLLYHLAEQALAAISDNLKDNKDLPRVVFTYRKAIAYSIYDQMKRHYVVTSMGYVKPNVLPFVSIVDQSLTEIEGYGRTDYRDVVPPAHVRKFIFTGFMKSYYTEMKFDSKTEQDFANVLEADKDVLKWLRPAANQFNIYWGNGAHRYEPDFVVETAKCIYLVETKSAKDVDNTDVLAKKKAAEEYCKNASEYTKAHGGKPWKYILLAHNKVERTSSFYYLMAIS